MKYAAAFLLTFCLAAGWAIGSYLATALCTFAKNTIAQRTKRKGTFSR